MGGKKKKKKNQNLQNSHPTPRRDATKANEKKGILIIIIRKMIMYAIFTAWMFLFSSSKNSIELMGTPVLE
jgi:hypothetical protein